ncbi:transcription factor HES-3-like [Bufo bufo]|uniref:transcription factor HES-3-like n=1 Tax=Bufo bufo TaxID=8384 RepID=UPI001ABE0C66|nr:transcription factor HES-3-like [Bufo bufo]
MVTHPESREPGSLRKVSKPLMEKKRRARINVSLEQLKTLLEKNYSQNIRKRKLEKADILELTVKYLKTLQNSIQAGSPVFSSEYQAGFRNCLSSVSQFLLKSEECGGHMGQLSLVKDQPLVLQMTCFSTKDSNHISNSASPTRFISHQKTPANVAYTRSNGNEKKSKESSNLCIVKMNSQLVLNPVSASCECFL